MYHALLDCLSPSSTHFGYIDIRVSQSSSPDEMALVVAARVLGYNFHSRQRDRITVMTPRGEMIFEILHVIEFTSDRKKMSVVARVSVDVSTWHYLRGVALCHLSILVCACASHLVSSLIRSVCFTS